MSRLEKLKKENRELLKKHGLKQASLESLKAQKSEEKKYKALNKALKNPESAEFKRKALSAVKIFGKTVKDRAFIAADNFERMQKKAKAEKVEREEREIRLARARKPAKKKQ